VCTVTGRRPIEILKGCPPSSIREAWGSRTDRQRKRSPHTSNPARYEPSSRSHDGGSIATAKTVGGRTMELTPPTSMSKVGEALSSRTHAAPPISIDDLAVIVVRVGGRKSFVEGQLQTRSQNSYPRGTAPARARLTTGGRPAPLGRVAAVHVPRSRPSRAQTLTLFGAPTTGITPRACSSLRTAPKVRCTAHSPLGGEHESAPSAPAHTIFVMDTRDPTKIDCHVMNRLNEVGTTAVPEQHRPHRVTRQTRKCSNRHSLRNVRWRHSHSAAVIACVQPMQTSRQAEIDRP